MEQNGFEGACKLLKRWSGRRGSNPRRPAWEAGILPLNYSRLLFTGRQSHYKTVIYRCPGDNTHLREKQYTTSRRIVSGFGVGHLNFVSKIL